MIQAIERRLRDLIPPPEEPLFEAALYSLLSPGKRIRPLLVMAASAVFGGDPLRALDPACAIEMVHVYSLIHDDLPCMDNDDLRRGQPTLHKVYGDAIALLAGDYLLTRAFDVISNAPHLTDRERLRMIQILAARAGAPGMIGGQAIDMDSQGKNIDETTLLEMHNGKTASLIIASLEIGSWASGHPASPFLASIGQDLGLAYQLQDDLLDATSTTAVLGKTAGLDHKNRKNTAVSIYGISQVREKLALLKCSLHQKLRQLPNEGAPIRTLIDRIFDRAF